MAGKGIFKSLVSKVLDGVEFVVEAVRVLVLGDGVCDAESPDQDTDPLDLPEKNIVCAEFFRQLKN